MAERTDDGRRYMPKLKCPYCMGRAIDSRSATTKNAIELMAIDSAHVDYVIICPKCKKPIGISIREWHTCCHQA